MKILISESQYNRILLEDALELTERISDHYEDRKKRIQESLNVVFEYGGPKNLIQTFGDSIPRLWNPSTNSLEKFVKPDKNMALGDSYIVGKFALGEEEYNSILKKLEFLENNHEKFFENTDKQYNFDNFFNGSFCYHWHNKWNNKIYDNSIIIQLIKIIQNNL